MDGSALDRNGPHAGCGTGFRLGHRPALDGLRGLAILAVMALHFPPHLARGGFLGVDLFLVLSGFLITTLLVQEFEQTGSIRLPAFFFRRALRLMPALVVLLFVYWAYALVVYGQEFAGHAGTTALRTLTYVQNFWAPSHPEPHALGHLWSLSVEGQFYLAWAVVLACLLRLRVRQGIILSLVLLAIGATAVWRALMTRAWERLRDMNLLETAYVRLDTRADALLMGCLAGLLVSWGWLKLSERPGRSFRWLTGAAILGLAYALLEWPLGPHGLERLSRGGYTAVAAAAAIVLVALLGTPPRLLGQVMESRLLINAGRLSYSLYLWHNVVAYELAKQGFFGLTSHGAALILQLAVTLPLAYASFHWVEQPFLRLKRGSRPRAAEREPVRRLAA